MNSWCMIYFDNEVKKFFLQSNIGTMYSVAPIYQIYTLSKCVALVNIGMMFFDICLSTRNRIHNARKFSHDACLTRT